MSLLERTVPRKLLFYCLHSVISHNLHYACVALNMHISQMLFNHGYIGDSQKKIDNKGIHVHSHESGKNMVGNEACVSLHVIKLRIESESA